MKPIEIKTLSVAELQKREKTATAMSWLMGTIILIQLISGIYLTTQQGFNVFLMLPLVFIPLLIVNIANVKKIKEEIARRRKK
ncbi:hypothetical protein [Flavobacterium sp.]|uniref:hypothetical protein n=1 Tax=Flavobacterium sp. TaxID=239 RepID=UPI002487354F|nr:hypothetical protein [Flavobacterium sp.]MDI1316608.1 hypothetical protein [Flavobacterium sp.]